MKTLHCLLHPVFVLVLVILGTLPAQAQQSGDFTYTATATEVTITGYTGAGGVVTIPDAINGLPVTVIGEGAFQSWISVTSMTIPSSVTSIGNSAFSGCINLISVSIPSSVTSIGVQAFSGCSSLTKITIPSSVTSIGDFAFSDCGILNAIMVDPENSNFSSLGGVLFDKNQTMLISYPPNKPGTAYTIPSSVTGIGSYAFIGCTQLTSMSIPSSVTSIGESAFVSCTQLASVSIPSSVTSIGHFAFYFCTSLQAVFFGGNPPEVGASVFSSGTMYYSFEATNWGATFAGRPTALMLNPIIISQPDSLSSNQGTTAILSVVAMGTESLGYQWEKNGVVISGATGATLELGNVQAADAGSYKVRVSSEWGSVTSNAANLSVVLLMAPPSITSHPSSIIANPGESAVFSIAATGSNLGYQWMRNGVIVAGATSSNLSFSAIQPVHVGTYAVTVSNPSGTVTSASVSLTLNTVYSQAQYDAIAQAAQAEIISSPNSYGLYSLSQVQALNVDVPLLTKDSVSGKFKLTVGAMKSTDLSIYTALPFTMEGTTINAQGKMEFEFSSPENAAFFRLESN
jgi:hypothetical protein